MAQTCAITDLGNDLQFEFSHGDKFILNKLTMKIMQTSNGVFITNATGFHQGDNNKILVLQAENITSASYADNDALVTALLDMLGTVNLGSGGGGVPSSDNAWSNAQGDFTAVITDSTKQITITALGGWVFDWKNVTLGYIERKNSSGEIAVVELTNIDVSGGVITLSDENDDFVTGDEVVVVLYGPKKAYQEEDDSIRTWVGNPDSAQWTPPEHIVDISAQAAATLRYVSSMEGYKDLSAHWKFSNSNAGDTITMTLWATNNADADDSADTDWVDISGDYLTKTLTVTNGTIEFAEVLKELFFLKVMIKLVVVSAAATNAADIYIKKKAL